ncbi:hypothetical protein GJ496_011284 [Pomphorhynchus laevis]|nr:hypothetical protein GJ496_011284 [Pomphorhynchus laevis]
MHLLVNSHEIRFLSKFADNIIKDSIDNKGSVRYSKLNERAWRCMLKKLGRESNELAIKVAEFAKNIATKRLSASRLEAFTTSRLISPDKSSGIRSIGANKVLRQIADRTIVRLVR